MIHFFKQMKLEQIEQISCSFPQFHIWLLSGFDCYNIASSGERERERDNYILFNLTFV